MSMDYIKPLLRQSVSKIVLMVMDGLGGLPIELGGPTELEAANTPNMDRLATEGTLGQVIPIRPGITPGSGPAHLALFGYDPLQYDIGRGTLEAVGVGMKVSKGDVAARGNFCTLNIEGIIVDRRAGRIPSQEAIQVVEKLKTVKLPGVETEVRHVKEYRFAVVMRGEGLEPDIDDTDPQQTGFKPLKASARTPQSGRAAELYNQWISLASSIIANEPKANGLTLRGFATHPGLASYAEVYGLRAACVAVYPMYRGVSQLVGMEIIEVMGETPEDEFKALAGVWNDFDFFFVHIKKTDSKGEDGDFAGKAAFIETVDVALPQVLQLNPDVLIITGDHSTPARLRTHSWHPIPFLLWAPETARADDQTSFGERSCARGGFGTCSSMDTMPLALAHALRLNKYGA
ncbi:MAG: phosphoglycerate mutase [Chloroflexi bacterium RBG_16_52_11]|nr:MAG: phosphoglycerate mutase [Chloroflexi bacterium RBG_16_52_11]